MTLLLKESDDVSLELLTPILASLERNNEVSYYLKCMLYLIGKFAKLSLSNLVTMQHSRCLLSFDILSNLLTILGYELSSQNLISVVI